MTIVIALMILFEIIVLGLGVFSLVIMKKKSMKKINKIIGVLMILFIVFNTCITLIVLINSAINSTGAFIIYNCVAMSITLYFDVYIGILFIKFHKNLKEDKIFLKENSVLLSSIGKNFIYRTLIEVVAGITLTIINGIYNYNGFDITVFLSSNLFFSFTLGLFFFVISILLDRSIEMYEENKLTI